MIYPVAQTFIDNNFHQNDYLEELENTTNLTVTRITLQIKDTIPQLRHKVHFYFYEIVFRFLNPSE